MSDLLLLLSNDDGIEAVGLEALATAVADMGTVYTVAPDGERSATSHGVTVTKPLHIHERPGTPHSPHRFAVTGTPADAVMLGIERVLPRKPDIVLSGINHGANLARDVHYSGTVAAALEGALHGCASMAFSAMGTGGPFRFDTAGQVIRQLVTWFRDHFETWKGRVINVNVPPIDFAAIQGYRVTALSELRKGNSYQEFTDPLGRSCYWIGPPGHNYAGGGDTDTRWIEEGYVTLTPLHPDMSDRQGMERLSAELSLPS